MATMKAALARKRQRRESKNQHPRPLGDCTSGKYRRKLSRKSLPGRPGDLPNLGKLSLVDAEAQLLGDSRSCQTDN